MIKNNDKDTIKTFKNAFLIQNSQKSSFIYSKELGNRWSHITKKKCLYNTTEFLIQPTEIFKEIFN